MLSKKLFGDVLLPPKKSDTLCSTLCSEIVGDKMKTGKGHRIPVSDTAVTLLKDLPRFKDNNGETTDY